MKTVEFLKKTYVVEGSVGAGASDNAIHLDTLPAAKLVEICNLLISNLDLGRRIKMFQSKAKGIKRVIALLIKFDEAFTDAGDDPNDDLPESMAPKAAALRAAPAPDTASEPTTAPETGDTAPAKGKVRAGSKQEALINMIKRPEGASIDEISKTLGWVNHTARGAISRDLKKRLGLPVTKARVEGRGWVYSIVG